jgi:hypothetical protein
LREVEAPTFSDIRLIHGGNVVSLTRRPLFTPRKIPGTLEERSLLGCYGHGNKPSDLTKMKHRKPNKHLVEAG